MDLTGLAAISSIHKTCSMHLFDFIYFFEKFSGILEAVSLNLYFRSQLKSHSLHSSKKSENNYLHINGRKRSALFFSNLRDALIMITELEKNKSRKLFTSVILGNKITDVHVLLFFASRSLISGDYQQTNSKLKTYSKCRDHLKRVQTKLTMPKVVHDWFFQIVLFK